MTEIWKDIDGFDDYQVSNLGKVKSFKRDKINGRILKGIDNGTGYTQLKLTNENGLKSYYTHRLVANAFLPNPSGKSDINHMDGNKTNNNASNLDWSTRQENMNHAFVSGLHPKPKKEIIQITKEGFVVGEYESMSEAYRQTGVRPSSISKCAYGEITQGGGFVWKFKNI